MHLKLLGLGYGLGIHNPYCSFSTKFHYGEKKKSYSDSFPCTAIFKSEFAEKNYMVDIIKGKNVLKFLTNVFPYDSNTKLTYFLLFSATFLIPHIASWPHVLLLAVGLFINFLLWCEIVIVLKSYEIFYANKVKVIGPIPLGIGWFQKEELHTLIFFPYICVKSS